MLRFLLALFAVPALAADFPDSTWPIPSPTEVKLDLAKLSAARDYALTGEGSGCIIHRGQLVMSWGDQTAIYDLKSSSKSIGVTLLGVALKDGLVRLDDPAQKYDPALGVPPEDNRATGWLEKITLRQLAEQTAGFAKPGGYERLLFAPGTRWSYSDGGPNWLADCLTLAWHRDLKEVFFARIARPLGITEADLRWRTNAYRQEPLGGLSRREFGSGFCANVPAMARIGYLYLREGWWKGDQILPRDFIEAARTTRAEVRALTVENPEHYSNASQHYGLLWWNNSDGTLPGVPRDAYWSWGLYDSFIVIIPSLDLVVARAGKAWSRREGAHHYEVLKPFLEPIAAAVTAAPAARSPYPQSSVVKGIEWAPKETIVRLGKGGDNWPMTWADDDALYTAYGDANGFAPRLPEKLSLGFGRVLGLPPDVRGENIRATGLETKGDGKHGAKASGLLMVDGALHLLARNTGNAQIASSRDRGATWQWAPWKFTESFGCPTFLNFGPNYRDARDEFVYLYSPDAPTAYERADQLVLARVPKRQLLERAAYEVFAGWRDGAPQWTRDFAQRSAVFRSPGACYRLGVSYDAGIQRYLLCMTGEGADTRFAGGFGIYDAPEPWGPWTTVFFTHAWDTGPGETSSLPTKWMSADGLTVHLVFSGEDSLSIRTGKLLK